MKVFLINLERDAAKRQHMTVQLGRLGVAFALVPAVDGRTMDPAEKRRAVNRFRWWCAIGLPARDAEIGCALSHYGIYRKLIDENVQAPVCILEDDVVLDGAFVQALAFVEQNMDRERPQVVMLSDHTNQYTKKNGELKASGGMMFQRSSAAMCTDAYVINVKAAAEILKENLPMETPCDHWWRWARKGAIELYHCLPSVADQDQVTFGTSTQGGLLQVKDYPLPKWVWHKSKRVIGKILDKILLQLGK